MATDRRGSLRLMLLVAAIAAASSIARAADRSTVQQRLPAGITPKTKQAIDRGLAYLARKQDRQGSWSDASGAYGAYPVAMTSLAGLALLMDGNTTTQGRYAPQVDRAGRYLLQCASPTGLIKRTERESRPMYGHGFATLFLSQLHGMTEDVTRSRQIHQVLTQAVQLTARAQSPLGGWIYTPDSHRDEGSVTVTQVQALRSCRNVGIAVPKTVIDHAMLYLDKSQNSDGGIRYTASHRGSSRAPITAAAVCCWYNAGEYDNPRAHKALEYCKRVLKPQARVGGHDFYAHLYYAQALYVGNVSYWDEYFPKRRDYLLGLQQPNGSWRGDGSVGSIYGTAVALIILQLPYNQVPIMQR